MCVFWKPFSSRELIVLPLFLKLFSSPGLESITSLHDSLKTFNPKTIVSNIPQISFFFYSPSSPGASSPVFTAPSCALAMYPYAGR